MCVVSMVIDKFRDPFQPYIPWIEPYPGINPFVPTKTDPPPAVNPFVAVPAIAPAELAELRQLIADFKEAIAAAKTVDRLTKQPDCEDPGKAKLIDRVAELEKRLAKLEKPAKKRAPKRTERERRT